MLNKIVQELDKLSNDPSEMGRSMAYQSEAIQRRFMEMSLGFINELSHQAKCGVYVNGNLDTAYTALNITESLLTTNVSI